MATRLYFPSSGAPAVTPALSGTWDGTGNSVSYAAVKTPISSANIPVGVGGGYCDGTPLNFKALTAQYVTQQWDAYEFTTADEIKLQIKPNEEYADRNEYLYAIIRVVSGDGGTFRGILFSGQGPTEFPIGAQNRSLGAAGAHVHVQNAVSMQAGDRITIEIGYALVACTWVGWTIGYLYIGDIVGDGDLNENETDTWQSSRPWVEFSPTIGDYSAGENNILFMLFES